MILIAELIIVLDWPSARPEVTPLCGIAGAIDLTGAGRLLPTARLRAMTAAIVHRGPGDLEPGLALGAWRLAIVDVAGRDQPIANADDSIWVAFDGELFEYPELRRDLFRRGHHLVTRSDTKAWVDLDEYHTEGVFHRAGGQFALSLWATGYFDPQSIAYARKIPTWMPILSPKRPGFDLGLIGVFSTQLWYHTFCGGGLCDLPSWTAPTPTFTESDHADPAQLVA